MPTFTAYESPDGLTARVNARSGRSLVRSFEVESDDPANTTGRDVIEALGSLFGIYIGVPHPAWADAACDDIDPGSPDRDDPRLWRPRVTYTEPVPQGGTLTGASPPPPGPSPPPPPPPSHPAPGSGQDHQPPRIKVNVRKLEVFDLFDLDGAPVVNAAGQPLDGAPPRLKPLTEIKYYRRVRRWDQLLAKNFFGKVNLDEWKGYPPDTLLIDGLEAEEMTEGGYVFWQIVFTILHDPRGWIPTKLRNAGDRAYTRGLPRIEKNLVPCIDTKSVVLLNQRGERYIPGEDPIESTVLNFRFYDRITFANL